MTSSANVLDPATLVVEQRSPSVSASLSANRPAAPPDETPAGQSDPKRAPADVPSATSSPGVLGSSLQRLYESGVPAGLGPLLPSQHTNPLETTQDLTESLLEAVFEISEFDPLPHFNYREDEFGFGMLSGSPHYAASARSATSKSSPADAAARTVRQCPSSNSPEGLSATDRRGLPRRESECVVSVCRCRGEERLTAERIAWRLHATNLKGQLVDVSMSGIAFHLEESLADGSRILLRIANRTLDKQVDVSAIVLRSRAARDGGWDVVCRFNKNLTFEQIHTVGRSLFAATIV